MAVFDGSVVKASVSGVFGPGVKFALSLQSAIRCEILVNKRILGASMDAACRSTVFGGLDKMPADSSKLYQECSLGVVTGTNCSV